MLLEATLFEYLQLLSSNLVFLTLGAGLGSYAWYTRDKYTEKELPVERLPPPPPLKPPMLC